MCGRRPSDDRIGSTGPGYDPFQLRDVARLQLSDGTDAEQAHGALDLVGQDVDGPVDAATAAGHQAVQVGPSDQGEAGAEGERGDDVGAVHDAGVQVHLEVAA